jgi:hypothetical protein
MWSCHTSNLPICYRKAGQREDKGEDIVEVWEYNRNQIIEGLIGHRKELNFGGFMGCFKEKSDLI